MSSRVVPDCGSVDEVDCAHSRASISASSDVEKDFQQPGQFRLSGEGCSTFEMDATESDTVGERQLANKLDDCSIDMQGTESKHKPASTFPVNSEGDSVLHLAIIHKVLMVLQFVAKALQSWISLRNNDGHTPLHLSVITDQPDVVHALCRRKADPKVLDHHGNTPLHTASRLGRLECGRKMMENFVQPSDCVQLINQTNYNGETCVHLAVAHPRVLQLMLDFGGNPNAQEYLRGWAPLHIAAHMGQAESIEILLNTPGVVRDIRCYDGSTPSKIAHKKEAQQCLSKLLPRDFSSSEDEADSDDDDVVVLSEGFTNCDRD